VSSNAKKIVLVDTNILIEAHRTGCLTALCAHHHVVSVNKCIEESQTGYGNRSPEETIPLDVLRSSLAEINAVSEIEIAALELQLPSGPYLDEGDNHLLAHAIARKDFYLLCGPDKAMVRAAYKLAFIERLVSLDQLATEAHIAGRQVKRLRPNFKTQWLEEERVKVRLGHI
jgi:hypothetical protein